METQDWEDSSILYITGGHYSMADLKKMYPNGWDDYDIIEVKEHGYMRHEFLGDNGPDEYFTEGWIWYKFPVKGVVTKATMVHIEEQKPKGASP